MSISKYLLKTRSIWQKKTSSKKNTTKKIVHFLSITSVPSETIFKLNTNQLKLLKLRSYLYPLQTKYFTSTFLNLAQFYKTYNIITNYSHNPYKINSFATTYDSLKPIKLLKLL